MADPSVTIRALGPERIVAFFRAAPPAEGAVPAGPGAWLMVGGDAGAAGAIDVSDAHRGFEIAGPLAADLLAQGIALDLDRAAPGFVGRTRLGDVAVMLWRTREGFVLRCERSYAEWLEAWLARALRLSAGGT